MPKQNSDAANFDPNVYEPKDALVKELKESQMAQKQELSKSTLQSASKR